MGWKTSSWPFVGIKDPAVLFNEKYFILQCFGQIPVSVIISCAGRPVVFPVLPYHVGKRCHSFSIPQGAWWASLADWAPMYDGKSFGQNPWLKVNRRIFSDFFQEVWKPHLSLTKVCFVTLQTAAQPTIGNGSYSWVCASYKLFCCKTARYRNPRAFFSFAHSLITRLALHSGGRRKLEMYPWRCFARFCMLVLNFFSGVSGQITRH